MNKYLKKFFMILTICSLIVGTFCSCKKKVVIEGKEFDTTKTYNICIAQSDETLAFDDMRKGFVVALKDNGFVEDINVKYSYENAKGKKNFATQIATAFIAKKPDLIVSIGSLMTEAIKEEQAGNDSTNVVFMGVNNAEKIGVCGSDMMPLYNITGVIDNHQIEDKLKYIVEKYPDIKSLGLIYDKNNNYSSFDVDYYKFYATGYKDLNIYTVSVSRAEDIELAMKSLSDKSVEGIILLDDTLINTKMSEIITFFKEKNTTVFSDAAEAISLGAEECSKKNNAKYGKSAGNIAVNILTGKEKTKEIKIETLQ